MRVTEGRLLTLSSDAVSQARDRAAAAANETSGGVRVSVPSDDVAAWVEAQRTNARGLESAARGTAMATSRDQLMQTDGALGAIGSALDTARELAVQMSNGTLSASDRASAATQIDSLRTQILGQANVRGNDGEYLLAGSKSNVAPFDATGAYVGDTATRAVATSEGQSTTVAINGTALTAASGVDVLATLATLSTQLTTNNVAGVTATLDDLKTAVTQVSQARATVSGSIAALSVADDARSSFELQLATRHSQLIDADPVAAASALANATNVLNTARAVATQVVSITSPQR